MFRFTRGKKLLKKRTKFPFLSSFLPLEDLKMITPQCFWSKMKPYNVFHQFWFQKLLYNQWTMLTEPCELKLMIFPLFWAVFYPWRTLKWSHLNVYCLKWNLIMFYTSFYLKSFSIINKQSAESLWTKIYEISVLFLRSFLPLENLNMIQS